MGATPPGNRSSRKQPEQSAPDVLNYEHIEDTRAGSRIIQQRTGHEITAQYRVNSPTPGSVRIRKRSLGSMGGSYLAFFRIVMEGGAVGALVSFGFIPSQAWFIQGAGAVVPIILMGTAVAFFLGYYSGYGALLAELFPTRVRSRGMGFCYSIGGIGAALGPPATGYLSSFLGIGRAFMIVSMIFLIGALLIRLFPETKGKKL